MGNCGTIGWKRGRRMDLESRGGTSRHEGSFGLPFGTENFCSIFYCFFDEQRKN